MTESTPRYKRFAAHNKKKIEALREALTGQRWKVFSALPALLHHNFAGLPGPGDGLEPHGFIRPNFAVDTFSVAAEYFPEFKGDPPPPRRPWFLGLYSMGSVGSVSFTSASDIDFWLIHAANALESHDREWLERKLRAIEQWAATTANLEIHFYIHDLAEIQKATFSYDAENAGEFGPILKEEFLRTAMHVAGLEPSHWHHATGDEAPTAIPGSDPTIDFGSIPRLTSEQYLSACLTQLEKALQKPFKSALKVALLRRLSAKSEDKLPSEIYAESIAAGETPDPYLLLLAYLSDYFRSINAEDDHTFLKSVLYLKTVAEETSPERLRRNRERFVASKFQLLGRAIDLEKFDMFFEWPFAERIRFSDQIAKYLQASLREISNQSGSRTIDPVKLRLLTKKVLLRRASVGCSSDTIENLTFADVPSRGEQCIGIVKNPNRNEWTLCLERFSGRPDFEKIVGVKSAATVVPLLAFAIKNRILNPLKTEVRGYPTDLFPRRSGEIIRAMMSLMEPVATSEWLDKASSPDRHLIIVEQPLAKNLESRIVTIMTRTTWDATMYKTFSGSSSLMDAFVHLLAGETPRHGVEFIIDIMGGPEPAELSEALGVAYEGHKACSIVKDQNQYLIVRGKQAFVAGTAQAILEEIGRDGGAFVFRVLPQDFVGRLMSEMLARVSSEKENLFQFKDGQDAIFFLIDHNGNCDVWRVPENDAHFNLSANLVYLQPFAKGRPVEYSKVEQRTQQPWNFAGASAMPRKLEGPSELHFKLTDGGMVVVRFGARILEHQAMGAACHMVAELIRTARKNGAYYPPFLTGITFPPAIESRITLPEATRMKRQLENRIGVILEEMY